MELQFPIVVGLIIGLLVLVGLVYVTQRIKRRQALGERLDDLPDFSATDRLLDEDGEVGLALDESRGKLALIHSDWDHCKIYSTGEVLAVDLLEKGQPIVQSLLQDRDGDGRVGKRAIKAVGALRNLVTRVSPKEPRSGLLLRIVVNDEEAPVHEIGLWEEELEGESAEESGMALKEIREEAKEWQRRLAGLISKPEVEQANT